MDLPMDFLSSDSVAPAEIAELLNLCFGPARQRRTAALLREGAPRIEAACFVVVDKGALVGSVEAHLMEWRHPSAVRQIALLGPLVSHPDRRGERIGARLMDLSLAELDKLGLPVMLIGDAPYYGKWGFTAAHTGEWQLPGPVDRARLLLRAKAPRSFAGPALLGAPGSASRAA
jgi:predicted N-acetyltransferase YhbS